MDVSLLINAMEKTQEKYEIVSNVETAFKCNLPDDVKKIVSLSEEPIFSNEWRTLSFKEIMESDNCLDFDFVSNRLLPLIDIFDNDFIVFDLSESCWGLFNLNDEIVYSKADTIQGLF